MGAILIPADKIRRYFCLMWRDKMKNITLRYSITQFSHWAAASGATAYATTYLLGKGMPAGWVGALLAAGGLLSCFAQPLLASIADRSRNNLLNRMLIALSLLCMFCFGMQMISGIPLFASGMLYLIAICCSDAMVSLLNALSVSANAAGFAINYGVARGVGAMASAAAALALGHVIARKGFAWMLVFLLIFRLVNIISLCHMFLLSVKFISKKAYPYEKPFFSLTSLAFSMTFSFHRSSGASS